MTQPLHGQDEYWTPDPHSIWPGVGSLDNCESDFCNLVTNAQSQLQLLVTGSADNCIGVATMRSVNVAWDGNNTLTVTREAPSEWQVINDIFTA